MAFTMLRGAAGNGRHKPFPVTSRGGSLGHLTTGHVGQGAIAGCTLRTQIRPDYAGDIIERWVERGAASAANVAPMAAAARLSAGK